MKKNILSCLLAIAISCGTGYATPLTVGTIVDDVTLIDINGNSTSLYAYLDQGYTVLIDLSATWCGPCWAFKQAHTLQNIYDHFGPEGTLEAKKIMPIFIEADPRTNTDDLFGNTTASRGDWVTGSSYPIIDAPSWELGQHFLTPGSTQINFPTFLLICPDRKVIWSNDGLTGVSEEIIIEQMNTCSATSVGQMEKDHSFDIYPNPATSSVTITRNQPLHDGKIRLINLFGKVLTEQAWSNNNAFSMDLSGQAAGLYIIEIQEGNQTFRTKLTKN